MFLSTAHHTELSPCQTIHCPQTPTEKVLLEALKAEPATSVRFNTEVTPLEQREDGVQLQLSSGESLPPNGGGG